ncbi:recombinase family protein [Streptomyces sp. NPDC096310]|uniref:recombinase family protein n=1 Tax=Streptomyces sp. NPDC096310 TaxID=3366082 RepID=UPI00380824FA
MSKTLMSAIETADRGTRARIRAVDYLRVSTEEQKKGYGIQYTGKKTAQYIAKKDWAHVNTYVDEGVSGSLPAHEREGLARLMRDARESPRPFDMVTVFEGRAIGRLGQAFWPWGWELEKLGIYVAVVKDDYDNSTAPGRSRMRKDADYAEEKRENIRTRTQGGIQEKAEDGLYPGGRVPFGWCVTEQGKKGLSHYTVSESESKTSRRAREIFVAKRSWYAVALTLNAEGLHQRNGKPWSRKNIRMRMLNDAVLKGQVVYRGKSAARDRDGNTVFGEPVVIELPQFFTPEEIEELKVAARAAPRAVATDTRVYILRGMFASECGALYRGHRNHENSVIYRCTGRDEEYAGAGGTCSCPPLEAEHTEAQVWCDVMALLGDAERMKAMAMDRINAVADRQVDYTARIAQLDQQIAEQTDVIDVTMVAAARQAAKRGLRGAKAEEAVERAVEPLEENRTALERLRRDVVAWQREAESATQQLRDFERLAEMARRNLRDLHPAEKHELLTRLEMEAHVVRAVARQQGVRCTVRAWFTERGRGVPILTDAGWERIKPLMGGSRSTLDRRLVVESLLHKARTNLRWRDMPETYGNYRSLSTQAQRWLTSGTWTRAMEELKDAETVPAWRPEQTEICVSLRPLAIESSLGDEDREGWSTGRPDRTPYARRTPGARCRAGRCPRARRSP